MQWRPFSVRIWVLTCSFTRLYCRRFFCVLGKTSERRLKESQLKSCFSSYECSTFYLVKMTFSTGISWTLFHKALFLKCPEKDKNLKAIQCVKSVHIWSYSGPHFHALGLMQYSASLRIQSECGKMRTRITPNTETFYAVIKTCSFYRNIMQ